MLNQGKNTGLKSSLKFPKRREIKSKSSRKKMVKKAKSIETKNRKTNKIQIQADPGGRNKLPTSRMKEETMQMKLKILLKFQTIKAHEKARKQEQYHIY